MMFYRTIITSDNTGFAELIVDGKNGFIFQNENYEDLMKKIKYVIDHINETLEMGNASRLIYEHNCKIDIFHNNYVNIVNKLIINHST
jgi:glycosyltransferase involved in cell wall biosynthesis